MNVSLHPARMLGNWTHTDPSMCEFQHGSTMIYVEYDDAHPMDQQLSIAQISIDSAFAEVSYALAKAEEVSAETYPAFWKQARRIALRQRPLEVFAVRYLIGETRPMYEISWNPSFEPECGVDYSDEWIEEVVRVELPEDLDFIHIVRVGNGQFQPVARISAK